MQPQPAEHLPADRRADPDAPGDREPDVGGDPRHGGARPRRTLPAVVGRPEHRGPGSVCALHPLLQVGSLRAGEAAACSQSRAKPMVPQRPRDCWCVSVGDVSHLSSQREHSNT